jgi:Rv2525c-like, glycoside hydrolase-like domain
MNPAFMNRLRFSLASLALLGAALFLVTLGVPRHFSSVSAAPPPSSYLGFDRNLYPGDDAMGVLRKTFAYTGYWLSPPPGEKSNTWQGKRGLLHSAGYGFLVLYRGRDSRELRKTADAVAKGTMDARDAIASAKREGFPGGMIIFLDIEDGGRLEETYHAYLRVWSEELTKAGFRPGVYCSAIPVKEEPGVSITTVDDIRAHVATHDIVVWAYNDACPPSPGCAFPENPPAAPTSGTSAAIVWQFAQSPRRREYTARCAAKYAKDGNCYAPGDTAHAWFLDVNSATSADPSGGR